MANGTEGQNGRRLTAPAAFGYVSMAAAVSALLIVWNVARALPEKDDIDQLRARITLFESGGPRFSADQASIMDASIREWVSGRFAVEVPPIITTEQIRVIQRDIGLLEERQRETDKIVWAWQACKQLETLDNNR